MNFSRIYLFFGAFLILVLAGCEKASTTSTEKTSTALDRSQRPAPGPAPAVSFPDYETVVLDNGLTLFVIESDRQPTITFRFMFRSGGLYDGDQPGLTELLAALLDKGVEGKDAFQLASETDFIGGSIGAEASSDFIAISVSGLSRYTETLLETLGDIILRPTFPEEELAKLKQRVVSNLVSERQEPEVMAGKLRRMLVYGDGSYGAYKTEESVESISRQDLIDFHQLHFSPNNATLAIVGDFEASEIEAQIAKQFGDWPAKEIPTLPDYTYPTFNGIQVHVVDRPESVQSAVRVAQGSIRRSDPRASQLRVVMSVLGGSNGRMYNNLRETNGYTYGAYAYAANAAKHGAIVTTSEVRNEVTFEAVSEMFNELNRIRDELIPQEELSLHQKFLAGNYMLSLESPLSIAQKVQEIDIYSLAPDYYQTYVDQIMSVTPAIAKELANELIHSKDCAVAIVGNASEIADSMSQFGPVTLYNELLEEK